MNIKVLSLTAMLVLSACSSQQTDPAPQLSAKMHKAAVALQELLPFIYDREAFAKPENKSKLQTEIANFRASIHKLDSKITKKTLGDDPYVVASLNNLHELADRSLATFEKGDFRTSRILLKATTNTCFKCHTRQVMGAQELSWKHLNIDKIKTDPIEKAHLFVAMRQYDEAKLYLANYLSEREKIDEVDADYETGLHYYLMLALRGQHTFNSALNFLSSKVLMVKKPVELHETLKSWEKDLQHWTKNAKILQPTLEHARGVMKRNKQPYNQRNLINNLVASSLLHQFLMNQPDKVEKAKAYALLGRAYDELVIEGFWDLPESYYEMCIRYAPKSPLAQGCYRKLHNNITLGYSGSRGTLIPAQEYKRLEELRKLSGL